MSEVKVVFSQDRMQFIRTCKEHGWNHRKMKFISYGEDVVYPRDVMTLIAGYTRKQIFPSWVADDLGLHD